MKKKILVLTAGALLVTAGTTVYAASTQDGNYQSQNQNFYNGEHFHGCLKTEVKENMKEHMGNKQHEMNRFHSNDSYRDYGMMRSLREGK